MIAVGVEMATVMKEMVEELEWGKGCTITGDDRGTVAPTSALNHLFVDSK